MSKILELIKDFDEEYAKQRALELYCSPGWRPSIAKMMEKTGVSKEQLLKWIYDERWGALRDKALAQLQVEQFSYIAEDKLKIAQDTLAASIKASELIKERLDGKLTVSNRDLRTLVDTMEKNYDFSNRVMEDLKKLSWQKSTSNTLTVVHGS
jgi:transposase-like protein